ncbi:uncharacterized protein LOC130896841 [Diorhabda carinulata]|uniref:uncharacterized protein LOC130896841 n=1 Tax=Diorhabda carinulata TaxID=1163345 RepID=UPI0025A1CF46|nr:uncharacterized protein LOC130896841 [Diorhabda carinulata]
MAVFRKIILNRKLINVKNKSLFSRCIATDLHENILRSETEDISIPNITVPELLYDKISCYNKYTATESASTGRKYTYEQIRIKSRNFSKSLRTKFQLKDGDVVALFLPNVPEFIICLLGSMEARMVITTMNPMYTADEIARQIEDASPKLIITQSNLVPTVKSALDISKRKFPIVIVKETQAESLPEQTVNFSELIDATIDIPDIQPGDANEVTFIPYSSGTTGLPKGVLLTHRNLVSNILQLSHPDLSNYTSPSGDFQDAIPAVLPMYHIYGLMTNFVFLHQGSRSIAMEKFTPESYINVLKNNPISMIFAAPPLVLFLASYPAVKPEYFNHLKVLFSGAAPLGILDEERFIQKIKREVQIIQGYGLTESSPAVSFTPKNCKRTEKIAGSIGRPVPNTLVKIINPDDPEGKPLGPNQQGELILKGPQVMKGYYNRPEETKNVFLNGWLRTGDLGYYNDEKLLFITDRLKELIKVRGFQVAPAELEEIIRDHPAVADVAVIGIPHPTNGEVPRAFVVPKNENSTNLDEIQQYVANKVAKYKRLEGGIEIVKNIPRNPSGKILRRQLKIEYVEKQK